MSFSIANKKKCDLKMDGKPEYPLWCFICIYGVLRYTLACVCTQTCYRPLTITFALLALNFDCHIEKKHVVNTSDPTSSKILQHLSGNTVFPRMRHLRMLSSYSNSKPKRPVA